MNLEQLKQQFVILVQTGCIIRDMRFGENKAIDTVGLAMDVSEYHLAKEIQSNNRSLSNLATAFCDVHYRGFPSEGWMLQHPFTISISKSGIGDSHDEI